MRRLRDLALVAAVAVTVFFTNLGGPRLWDRDEPRNAGCAREMLAAGDWVTPTFNAELRVHKPVLLYWLMMSAYAIWGATEFAARVWSAALAVGTVLTTYHLGRRLFNAQVGVWAGVILSTAFMFDVAARAATPDSVLIFFSTLAMWVYVRAKFPEPAEEDAQPGVGGVSGPVASSPDAADPATLPWLTAVLMYGLMGVGVLAKGPVGLVLPTAVLGMFLLIVTLPPREGTPRRLRFLRPFAPGHFLRTCWRMRPLTALAAALAVALPWYVWVHIRTDGEWTRGFFLTHNLGRATTPMEGHDGSLLYYPAAVLVGFFPWSVFAAPVLIDLTTRLRRGDPRRWSYLFATCWVGVYIGLFSLARTKLPSYITPTYPALALLTGAFLHHWTQGTVQVGRRWPRLALGALGLVGVGIMVALPLAARRYAPGEEWLGVLGLLPLGAAAVADSLARRGRTLAAARMLAAGAVLLAMGVFGFASLRADRRQQNHLLLQAIAQHSRDPQLGSWGCLEPSWVFYAGRPIRPLNREDLTGENFFAPGRESFVITTRRQWQTLEDDLPDDVQVLAAARYFLKDEELVVLGRPQPPAAVASGPQSDGSRRR